MLKEDKIKNDLNKEEKVKVFQQFKKQKIFSQITFVFAALVVGFGINSFVLNGEYGSQLKTNLLEKNQKVEKKADIYFEKVDKNFKSVLKINLGKEISQIKDLSLSLIYNPEEVTIEDIFSKIKGANLSRLENEKGVVTLILNFEEIQNIKNGVNIIELYISKNTEKTTQNINIINSNFSDGTNERYILNTSGITF